MALDGIFLNLLSRELKDVLIGAKVDKIYQTQKVELVLSLRTRSGAYRLLMSASGNSPRIHLTTHSIENPANPPMLCMLLRKQLCGAVLVDIRQDGFERILKLVFSATDELGDKVERSLIIEIMAQYSNIILTNENGIIIDSVKRVDSSKSSVRQILPSLEYTAPPKQTKMNILEFSSGEIIEKLKLSEKKLSSAILDTVQGVSPIVCREIAHRCSADEAKTAELCPTGLEKLKFELEVLKNTAENGVTSPTAVSDADGKLIDFSFMPITQYGKTAVCSGFESLSELLEEFYFERERLVRTKEKSDGLFKTVNNLIERLSKKISVQTSELEKCASRDEKKLFAELINANLYRLKKGESFYELENYYDCSKTVKIPVKPELTPSENARKYYKEYKKLKTAENMLTELIENGKRDLAYLQTVLDELSRAETEREIGEIRAELVDGGYIKRSSGAKQKRQKPTEPLEFASPDGFRVFVGRNNVQNDRLSMKTAMKNDLWFHVQKAPGSHVVLCCEDGEASEAAMEFAAKTAAYYSSERASGAVEVDYTRVKNLKKTERLKARICHIPRL